MNMTRTSQNYLLHFLVLITLIDIIYSHDNATLIQGQRHGRVSGRIVKLYSGPKPDPILCLSEGFLADDVDCSVFYRCLKGASGKYTVYRFQCGPGTVYDPDTEVCNHPRSTKRSKCGGLSSDKIIPSTERYIENEIDGSEKENPELPMPITTKSPIINNSLLSTTTSAKPVKLQSSYITTSYPWLFTSNQMNNEITPISDASKIPVTESTKKPWNYTPTKDTSITRKPTTQNGVQCTSDGFMGDNEDCRKFYRCVNNQRGGYIRYEFSCSESTIWDDDAQGCNHPWAVQRSRCGKGIKYGENGENYIENIKDNEVTSNNIIQHQTQIPYGSKVTQTQTQISVNSNETDINFGDRLNVDSQAQIGYGVPISQDPTEIPYGNRVTQTQQQLDFSNYFSQTQTLDNLLSSTTTTSSIPYAKESSSNKCTKAGFVSDTNDCKKFYRCIPNVKGGFTIFELSCNDGTLWDQQIEACNHAWAVKECGGKKSSQNIPPATAVTENTTFKYHTTTSTSVYSNEVEDIGYGSQSNQHELQRPSSSTETKTPISSTATLSVIASKPYGITECKSSGFFGSINDCSKFYRCVENGDGRFTKYEYKCGDGTVWDSSIESCNHAWAVKSCSTSTFSGPQNENIVEQSKENNTILTTVSLIQTTTQRNMFNQDYDSGYHTLDRETPLQSITTTTTERIINQGNECKTTGFMGDSDCKKFYRCTENGHGGYTRHEFTCGDGTLWDSDIQACNHAWAVKNCGDSSMKESSTTMLPPISHDNLDNNYNTNQNLHEDFDNTIKTTTSTLTTNFATVAINKGNDCETNGFMGDDTDCKIFYRCVENGNGGYTRYEFSCGDGTVWDPKIAACNHAWAVEKCGGSNSVNQHLSSSTQHPNLTTASIDSEIYTQHTTMSSSSTLLTSTISSNQCKVEGFIGDEQNCNKFYRCVEDGKGSFIRYEFACGEGTIWDPTIQACNHAWAVKSCKSNKSPNSETTSTSHPTMKEEETNNYPNNQEVVSSTENNLWSSSTVKSSTALDNSAECTSDGFMGDVNDCKKFYRCVDDGKGSFTRYEFSCGDGTVWDSEMNACNHVNSVKTPCTSISTDTTISKEPQYTISTPSADNDNSTTSKEPPKSQKCKQEGFFGDQANCRKFYRCTDNGQGGFNKHEFTCGEGTIWDQEILACNHASSNLHCGSTDKESQIDNSDPHSTMTSTDRSQSTEKTQTSLSTDECLTEGFYANPNDCKKFFRCVGNGMGGFTRYDFTCGDGTIWVQDIQACDHDSDTSVCNKETIRTTTSDPSYTSQEKPLTTSSISIASSTTVRTSTSSMKPVLQDDPVSGSSTSESSPSSSTSNSEHDRCEEAGYFGNSKDCKMFYRCVDNEKGGFTKYDFTCGEGTIWDQDITACNHPQDVSNPSCEDNGDSSTTTTTTTSKTTTTTTSSDTSTPTKGTSSTETTTTQGSNQSTHDDSTKKPSSNNYTCNEAGFYADPYDCKKFYRCVDWGGDGKTFSIYHFDCGEGTIWDPNLQTCNHEESVYPPRDCSGTQSQNENANNTSTTAKQDETTESTTTEESTTTTKSTTQTSTTEKSTTTTELSSTTDQTTTQQSSTSDQISSTPESSTQSSTTEQSTTQKSTTEQSTTEPNTTQQSTTEQSTTQQSTTKQSTTEQSTTTSEQTTTQQSTTKQSTTEQSTTTSEQTTTQQPSTTQSTTSEPTTTTTDHTTTTSNEETTTMAQTTTSEATTSGTDQTTKSEQSTTQESTEESSQNPSSTTEQSTTQETTDGTSTTESTQDTTTQKESSDKECPQTEEDQYLFVCPTGFKRHPKYCNLFYQCTEDDESHEMKVAVFNCPNNTIYDESKTQCVEESKTDKKCDGEIAQRRRVKRLDAYYKEPITVGKEKYFCPTVGHFPFEKSEECSPVLFKCDKSKSGRLRGFIYRCPAGYVYWSISRRCEPISTMTDCKLSLSNWNDRYEIPIERNNVARKIIN